MKALNKILSLASIFVLGLAFLNVFSTSKRLYADQPYENDMRRFEKEDEQNPPNEETTFFVGSSTFTIWKEIPQDFSEFHAVNRGFGGSQIVDWLNFGCERALVKHKPNRIVFFCGCNDIAAGKSEEETFENYKKFVAKMRELNPNLNIHFCALHMPPVREQHWDAFRKFNADVKALTESDSRMFYVDFATATDGKPELFQADRLHLTREGEKVLIPLIVDSIRAEISQQLTKQNLSFPLGSFQIDFKRDKNDCVISLTKEGENTAFAASRIPSEFVDSILLEFNKPKNRPYIKLTSGWKLFFDASPNGFVVVDYVSPTNGELTWEEPITWTLTGFDQESLPNLKSFGTAGVKPIDAHKGSYAFLSIVDPESRRGVVGGWITSETSGGVVLSNKNEVGLPTYTPRLDFGTYQNNGREFCEQFVLGPFDDCRLGLESYADEIASHYEINLKKNAINGYCTWYSDKNGGACREEPMRTLADSIVEKFDGYGFQYVQIDDGWQLGASKNGPNKNFTEHNPNGPYPSGMSATSEFLNDKNLIAGIWFMPFSGNFDDPYWNDKQDLFARSAIDYPEEGQKNTRRYSSINQKKDAPYETFWGGTALDTSNPKTIEYIESVVSRIVNDWGYKFLKIDGLWVGGAIEQLYVNDEYVPDDMGKQIFFDPSRTNVENYRLGLTKVRQTANDAFILGCNVSQNMRVLAASYGLVDAMRVGPDNGASWDGVCAGPWRGTNRYFYNARVWYNDPDPVYVRTSIPIERAQVSATWAAISGQLYALSDWIPDYDDERTAIVRKTIPNHQCKNVRPVDLFDVDLARAWILTDDKSGVRRDVVAFFNWKGGDDEPFEFTPEKLGLPLKDDNGNKIERYVAYDFWNDEFVEPFDVLKTTLKKESCKVFAVRPVGNFPVLLSSSRHVAQCALDVESEIWLENEKTLRLVVDVPEKTTYELRVYNPLVNKLDRWTAPDGAVGKTTLEYRLDENNLGSFVVVK